MAAFYHIVHSTQSSQMWDDDDGKFDIISALPAEISTSILRMLDPASMYAAMRVSKTWNRLYRGDRPLKRALRRKVIEQREQRMLFICNLSVKPTDSWYRTQLPVSQRLRTADKLAKKRKRTSTKHKIQSAKLLRI